MLKGDIFMSDAWMVIQTIFSNVRWLPVFGVSILATVIGVLWHLPFLFRKIRAKETDGEGGARKINKPAVIALSLLLYFIVFTNLSIVVAGTGAISALLTSLQISIVWLATALGITYLHAGRSWRLLAVDSGLYVVLFALGGLALGIS